MALWSAELILVTDPDGPLGEVGLARLGAELAAGYQALEGVRSVGAPFPGLGTLSLLEMKQMGAPNMAACPSPRPC